MTSVVVTQTTINASVVQESVSVSVTSSPINVTISPVDINSHSAVTIGTANGLSLSGQVLSLGLSSALATGALSSTDWSTFNGKLSDAPSDGTTYGRLNGAWSAVVSSVAWGGITGTLSNQTDLQTALNAKQNSLTFPLASTLGGTGVNNAGTITNASNTTITGGGTVALGGFTLTVPATGTAALLATANVFTTQQMVDGTSDQIQLRVQAHSTQTTNLITLENSSGTVQSYFDGTGRLNVGNVAFQSALTKLQVAGTGDVVVAKTASDTANWTYFLAVNTGNKYGYFGIAHTAYSASPSYYRIKSSEVFLFSDNASFHFAGLAYQVWGTGGVDWLYLDASGNFGISRNNTVPAVRLHVSHDTATTNAVVDISRDEVTSSGTAAAGFGPGHSFFAETATGGTIQQQGLISTSWIDATNASRKAKMSLSAYDTAARLGIEIEADGSAANINVFGKTFIDLSSDVIGLRVQAAASPTASLQTWEQANGTVWAKIDQRGMFFTSRTLTDTSGTIVGVDSYILTNPASSSSALMVGGRFRVETGTANAITGYIAGVTGTAYHFGTNTLNNVYGLNYVAGNFSTGTVTLTEGIYVQTVNSNASGTATTMRGIRIDSAVNTGTTVNLYGLFISNQTGATTLNYAIFTNSGLVRFGDIVNTTESYQVDGTQVVTNRVIDARIDDVINSGDATTDGVIDAIRDALITHGLIAAA